MGKQDGLVTQNLYTYESFKKARYRCLSPKSIDYKNYGGRGIEFRFSSFAGFLSCLGSRPKGKTLDRIDNEGHYEAGNVRWASHAEQFANKRHGFRVGKEVRYSQPFDWMTMVSGC